MVPFAARCAVDLTSVYNIVDGLEKGCLKKNFSSDLLTVRLERLEIKLFGRKQPGTIRARIDALTLAASETSESPIKVVTNKSISLGEPKQKTQVPANTLPAKPALPHPVPPASAMSPQVPVQYHNLAPQPVQIISPNEQEVAKNLLPQKSALSADRQEYRDRLGAAPVPVRSNGMSSAVTYSVQPKIERKPIVSDSHERELVDSYMSAIKAELFEHWSPTENTYGAYDFAVDKDGVVSNVQKSEKYSSATQSDSLDAFKTAILNAKLRDSPVEFKLGFTASFAYSDGFKKIDLERGKPSATVTAPPSDDYLRNVERRLKRAWFPQRANEFKDLTISFVIHHDGQVSDTALTKAAGNSANRQAVMKALEDAAPFRPMADNNPEQIKCEAVFANQGPDLTDLTTRVRILEAETPTKTMAIKQPSKSTDFKLHPPNDAVRLGLNGIRSAIEKQWKSQSSGLKSAARLSFDTNSIGGSDVSIDNSSAHKSFDAAAKAAVVAAKPFRVNELGSNPKRASALLYGDGSVDVFYSRLPDWDPYMKRMNSAIKAAWHPPSLRRTIKASVVFRVLSSGEITNIRYKSDDPDNSYKEAALAAMKVCTPLEPLPEFSPDTVDMEYQFSMTINGSRDRVASKTEEAPVSNTWGNTPLTESEIDALVKQVNSGDAKAMYEWAKLYKFEIEASFGSMMAAFSGAPLRSAGSLEKRREMLNSKLPTPGYDENYWFHQAANKNYEPALFKLGQIYQSKKDFGRAEQYYKRAAALGNEEAKKALLLYAPLAAITDRETLDNRARMGLDRVECYTKLTELYPDEIWFWLSLAESITTSSDSGTYGTAKAVLDRAQSKFKGKTTADEKRVILTRAKLSWENQKYPAVLKDIDQLESFSTSPGEKICLLNDRIAVLVAAEQIVQAQLASEKLKLLLPGPNVSFEKRLDILPDSNPFSIFSPYEGSEIWNKYNVVVMKMKYDDFMRLFGR